MAGGGVGGGGGGKEGDWECVGCRNINYAFRSFCNRCKQPRLLVDMKTPSDSKWLPRIGDWICTGCTNNNYASREKCKKCGQPKEVAAMPAVPIPGASVPTHPTYFPREQMMNVGPFQPFGGAAYVNRAMDPYGLPPESNWPVGQLPSNGGGWRNGDWLCTCGFHNYSSRAQCKKCSAPAPINRSSPIGPSITALGTKRLASEEFVHNWNNKRLNAGQAYGLLPQYPGFEAFPSPSGLRVPATPSLLGKGSAKQWRSGDWMCTNCNNHNYASREQCNRCKSRRDETPQPVSVA